MTDWKPESYNADPTVNAMLNIAAGLHAQAAATRELLYGLKYGKDEGMSIAEAIEMHAKEVGTYTAHVATAIQALADSKE
jgi:hypothetical protein